MPRKPIDFLLSTWVRKRHLLISANTSSPDKPYIIHTFHIHIYYGIISHDILSGLHITHAFRLRVCVRLRYIIILVLSSACVPPLNSLCLPHFFSLTTYYDFYTLANNLQLGTILNGSLKLVWKNSLFATTSNTVTTCTKKTTYIANIIFNGTTTLFSSSAWCAVVGFGLRT